MTHIDRTDPDRGLTAAVLEARPPAPAARRPDGTRRGRSRLRPWLVAVVGAIILPLVVTASLTWTATFTDLFAHRAADARVVSAAELEGEFGIRVDLVAVTAGGGLVDVRFTVLDREKAGHVLHDAAELPQLLLTSTGAVLRAPQPRAHKLDLVNGASYFLLYPNSGGVVQAGAPVSVVIDEIRLAPVAARS